MKLLQMKFSAGFLSLALESWTLAAEMYSHTP